MNPLQKRRPTGDLYTRPPDIERKLRALEGIPRSEVLSRCKVRDRSAPDYVPSECLLYLVRACRNDNSEAQFERLYKILMERVMAALPRDQMRVGNKDRTALTKNRIKERAFDRFVELLCKDRIEYLDTLDYFEVKFDGAVANLRRDAQDRAWREENRKAPLEYDSETGELSAEVESAVGSFDPFEQRKIEDEDYRLRLDVAIDSLPPEQSRIIQMLRQEFPIESKDPDVMSIVKALDVSEKTVRNRRDRAFAALRRALSGEES